MVKTTPQAYAVPATGNSIIACRIGLSVQVDTVTTSELELSLVYPRIFLLADSSPQRPGRQDRDRVPAASLF